MKDCLNHSDIDIYLTLAGTYRAYIKERGYPLCDAWSYLRSSALLQLIKNMTDENITFDFSDAPISFWRD